MRWLGLMSLVCALACRFDTSGNVSDDGGTIDADRPDAEPPAPGVELIATDPFGDGTRLAYIAGFDARIYLGPSDDGKKLVRMSPDGEDVVLQAMSFPDDTTGSNGPRHGPTDGIGSVGCTPGDDCGPDNEVGRGHLASGSFQGGQWLILGGARDPTQSDLDYVYMLEAANVDTGTAAFSYVDLSAVLGANTKGMTAAHVAFDRLYLGFNDTGGSQPYLIDLQTPPTPPGIDPAAGAGVVDLNATSKFGLDTGGVSMIDAMFDLQGRLYVGNSGGWVRSDPAAPPTASDDDWRDTTPSAAAYTNKPSIEITKVGQLVPSDRALVNMVQYQSRVYAARNTVAGPQLWVCIPNGVACEPDEWQLVAPNTILDSELTQFDDAGNTSITLLESTNDRLFVGFDNASGAVIYRTDVIEPAAQSDFTGDDCTAGPGCDGFGGNGFGDPTNGQILDSETIQVGPDEIVFAIVSNDSKPVQLYRFGP